ncbi:serine hydrolase [[Mycoplasma] testudinis]|uniref:serine hydrolase n=1 Tax=[Mycoplasma] testudinis TaxID=33924 RepID=UPI0006978AE4|nr:serine hydrolase [[Mycoplasma] testudinis]
MSKNIRGSYKVDLNGATIDRLIGNFMEENEVGGLALSIVQAPYISRVVNYGTAAANSEGEKLVSGNTVFPVGRISQGYMAIAVMQAYENKLLDLDDSIDKFFKVDKQLKAIKIKNLLQHTSGLIDFTKRSDYSPIKIYDKKQIAEWILKSALHHEPNTQIEQNPSNFYLLSLIIDKVTKMSYEAWVNKNQIERLKLKNTFFLKDKAKHITLEKVKKIHDHQRFKQEVAYIDGQEIAESQDDNLIEDVNLRGYCDIYASAYEISFWDIALAGTVLVKEGTNRKFIYSGMELNGKTINASCGWQFTHSKGFMDIYDNTNGFTTYLSRFTDPADLVCVTILATKQGLEVTELAREIAAAFKTDLMVPANQDLFTTVESRLNAPDTYEKLKKLIQKSGNTIFAEVDHQKNAVDAKMKLNFNKVITFGNPAVGTHLIQDNPWMGSRLPLSIGVYEDSSANVWVTTENLMSFAKLYNLDSKCPVLKKIKKAVVTLINKAASVY